MLVLVLTVPHQKVVNIKMKERIFSLEKDLVESEQEIKEIHKLNKFMKSIIDSANVALIVVDKYTNILFWNRTAEEITGYSYEEVVENSRIWKYLFPNEDYRNQVYQEMKRIIQGHSVENLEINICRKDGEERLISCNACNLVNEEDKPTGTVWIGRDITEFRRMQKELQKFDKLKSVGTLAGGIAHDFNNLMTGVLGNISLARFYLDENKLEEIVERLEKAEEASNSSKDLTSRLLIFAEGGTPVKEIVSVSEILRETTSSTLTDSNVEYEFYIPDNLWLVEVDKNLFRQVVKNLVINAQEAMHEGGTLKIKAENVDISDRKDLPLKEGRYIKISVEDEGIGIPEENLYRIFDPYFTTKEMSSKKGTGLGLAICHSIVEKHSGYITVESEIGVGTTFYIYLPVYSSESFSEKKRILLMDDEEMVRRVGKEILNYLGYNIELAKDGTEAIKLYKKAKESNNPFSAVILDLTVKGDMGGREALEELLKIEPEVKAIVSSGYSTEPVISNYREYGFSEAIVKPYKIKEMGDVLRKVIC